MDVTSLMLGVVFSAIGFGFFLYGKKQKAIVPLLSGVGLMVYPYFVTNPLLMIVVGCALIAVPYFIRE